MKSLICLISGTAVRSDLRLFSYWGKVPRLLKAQDFEVLLLYTEAFGSISNNVESIKKKLKLHLQQRTYRTIHVYGHSRGGIEALYLLKDEYLKTKISSITLLNSPVTGHTLAAKLSKRKNIVFSGLFKLINYIGRIQGDNKPNVRLSLAEIGDNHLQYFDNLNDIKVYMVQSNLKKEELPFFWKLSRKLFYHRNCIGDGLVEYQQLRNSGITDIPVASLTDIPFTHNSATGLPCLIRQSSVNIEEFWQKLLKKTVLRHNHAKKHDSH